MSRLEEIRETIEMLLGADAWFSSENTAVEYLIHHDGLWLLSQAEEAEELRGRLEEGYDVIMDAMKKGCLYSEPPKCLCLAHRATRLIQKWEREDRGKEVSHSSTD